MTAFNEYRIDMVPGTVPEIAHISEKDQLSRVLRMRLRLNGGAFTVPAAASVQIVGRKANGETFSEDATASGDLVTIPVTSDMSDTAGPCICRICITNGSQTIASQLFTLMVEKDPIHGITPDTDDGIYVEDNELRVNVDGPYVEDGILYNLPDASVTGGILSL